MKKFALLPYERYESLISLQRQVLKPDICGTQNEANSGIVLQGDLSEHADRINRPLEGGIESELVFPNNTTNFNQSFLSTSHLSSSSSVLPPQDVGNLDSEVILCLIPDEKRQNASNLLTFIENSKCLHYNKKGEILINFATPVVGSHIGDLLNDASTATPLSKSLVPLTKAAAAAAAETAAATTTTTTTTKTTANLSEEDNEPVGSELFYTRLLESELGCSLGRDIPAAQRYIKNLPRILKYSKFQRYHQQQQHLEKLQQQQQQQQPKPTDWQAKCLKAHWQASWQPWNKKQLQHSQKGGATRKAAAAGKIKDRKTSLKN